ncbi:hypothetical protein AMECASPLE_038264 [Ameca splendens]|uniref:Uncharacterized protein n=1 Tax=Ameca splendens TaxID=208324 RepID=A0ABV0XXL4_9TELE
MLNVIVALKLLFILAVLFLSTFLCLYTAPVQTFTTAAVHTCSLYSRGLYTVSPIDHPDRKQGAKHLQDVMSECCEHLFSFKGYLQSKDCIACMETANLFDL